MPKPVAQPPSPTTSKPPPQLTRLTATVAITGALLYVGAAVALLHLARDPSVTEPIWTRLTTIFNGVTSVGFACFGALLGTTVQAAKVVEAKAESAKKSQAMNDAMEVLASPSPQSGSGLEFPTDDTAAEGARTAYRILRSGLA